MDEQPPIEVAVEDLAGCLYDCPAMIRIQLTEPDEMPWEQITAAQARTLAAKLNTAADEADQRNQAQARKEA